MPEIEERNSQLEIAMPRREFIRKSLIASGGVFVGMTALGNVSLPELTSSKRPRKSSSGSEDDQGEDENDGGQKKGGRFGGYRW